MLCHKNDDPTHELNDDVAVILMSNHQNHIKDTYCENSINLGWIPQNIPSD